MKHISAPTSKQEQKQAQSVIPLFVGSALDVQDDRSINVKIQGRTMHIPKKALQFLAEILNDMAEGKSITIVSTDAFVSTQQAADILNVSRPFVVKLLEEGKMPFTKAGTHRRIELKHVLELEKKMQSTRRKNLASLAKHAQEFNLGY